MGKNVPHKLAICTLNKRFSSSYLLVLWNVYSFFNSNRIITILEEILKLRTVVIVFLMSLDNGVWVSHFSPRGWISGKANLCTICLRIPTFFFLLRRLYERTMNALMVAAVIIPQSIQKGYFRVLQLKLYIAHSLLYHPPRYWMSWWFLASRLSHYQVRCTWESTIAFQDKLTRFFRRHIRAQGQTVSEPEFVFSSHPIFDFISSGMRGLFCSKVPTFTHFKVGLLILDLMQTSYRMSHLASG